MRSRRAFAACSLVLCMCLPAIPAFLGSPSVTITAPVEGQLVQTPFLNITFGKMNHQSHLNTPLNLILCLQSAARSCCKQPGVCFVSTLAAPDNSCLLPALQDFTLGVDGEVAHRACVFKYIASPCSLLSPFLLSLAIWKLLQLIPVLNAFSGNFLTIFDYVQACIELFWPASGWALTRCSSRVSCLADPAFLMT